MTCIAWDGRNLAGDRLAAYGGTMTKTRKVFRLRVAGGKTVLVAGVGEGAVIAAWRQWMVSGRDRPQLSKDVSFTGLVVDDRLRLWQHEWTLVPFRVCLPGRRFYAIGVGRGEALGAMEMGADARRAVQVAARFDDGVGLGVDVVRFR